jgi:transcription antitermination factor NusG
MEVSKTELRAVRELAKSLHGISLVVPKPEARAFATGDWVQVMSGELRGASGRVQRVIAKAGAPVLAELRQLNGNELTVPFARLGHAWFKPIEEDRL